MENSSYGELTTEAVNEDTRSIDSCSTVEMLELINRQDSLVPAAVGKEIPNIAKAVDAAYRAIRSGGRLIYIGAGTSGRLGVLDAAECPPTFGTDPSLVQAYIAGGDGALRRSAESCEDDAEAGRQLVRDKHITAHDVLVGLTASGSAAYVLAAVEEAKKIGATTVGISNNRNAAISSVCDISIIPIVGPEAVMGSTRMKAGTAQKLVLNMISTGTMIRLGKVYGNLMVDLKATNKKLRDRAVRIVCKATGVTQAAAGAALQEADGSAKLAILMIKTGQGKAEAQKALEHSEGHLKKAISAVQ